jgi:hypothetical protein
MLDLTFDLKAQQAKLDLDDAVRPFMPQAVPSRPAPQQPAPMFGLQGQGPGRAAAMGMMPMGGGASLTGNVNVNQTPQGQHFMQGFGAQAQMPAAGGGLSVGANMSRPAPNMPMQPNFNANFNRGNFGVGMDYTPEQKALMLRGRMRFAKGGFAVKAR